MTDTVNRSRRFGSREPLSEAELAEKRKGALVLSDYQRTTLATQLYRWGDEMLRLLTERAEAGLTNPEREDWMADQVDAWYELADALRSKRTVK